MENRSFFQRALSNFVHDFASGDVIRRYAEMGYSVSEIKEHLDYPTSAGQVRKIAWDHLVDNSIILYDPPTCGRREKYEYVKDISSFGKVSFRKVKIVDAEDEVENWEELRCSEEVLRGILDKISLGQDVKVYARIPFGVLRFRDPQSYKEMLGALSERDAAFIDEFFMERRYVYYRLNRRMAGIIETLFQKGFYDEIIHPMFCVKKDWKNQE